MKIYLDSIGCRLNQAEIEIIARQFRAAGHEIVGAPGMADIAVVNTCAVTAEAASDSRGAVRRIARAGVPDITVTGCWATLHRRSAAQLPQVRRVVDNRHKDGLVADALGLAPLTSDLQPLVRQPLPGLRRRTRAFIKVQDGCNNRCTFCITTVARGTSISRSIGDIVADIQAAVRGGSKEIVLTGVHLGSWGQESGLHLRNLVSALLQDTDTVRLRLSSLEPWDLDAHFFRLWENHRLCRHLHLPLQSGCDTTLRRMARKTTAASYRQLVHAARDAMPDVAVTTDIIAGFPGETPDEFCASLEFVDQMQFAGGHAFSYSPRPGTPAARMSAQVLPPLRKQRTALYRAAFERSAAAYRAQFIGQAVQVLWESTSQAGDDGWQMAGLTGNYLRVIANAKQPLWNQISSVLLQSCDANRMSGIILD